MRMPARATCPSDAVLRQPSLGRPFVAPALTVSSGRSAVGACVATGGRGAFAVACSVGARLDGHLRLILGKRFSHGGAQIASRDRLVARVGGAVSIIRRPIMHIPCVGRGHNKA